MIRKCLDCSVLLPKDAHPNQKRCKPCGAVEKRRQTRASVRKGRGFNGVVICKICDLVIRDTGRKGNRKSHSECLEQQKRLQSQRSSRKGMTWDEGKRLALSARRFRIKKEFFNISELQEASPDRFVRMVQTMRARL